MKKISSAIGYIIAWILIILVCLLLFSELLLLLKMLWFGFGY